MLTKKTFIKSLETIRRQEELTDKLNEAYCEMNPGFYGICTGGLLLNQLIEVMEDAMEDIGQTISWWLFEDVDKVIYWEEDGKEISVDVTTPEDLYDYLVDAANARKEKADE